MAYRRKRNSSYRTGRVRRRGRIRSRRRSSRRTRRYTHAPAIGFRL